MDYTPDRWVILTIKTEIESIDKVFAGWYGGSYAGGDRWKLSSGIVDVTDDGEYVEFVNHSGSVYRCYKDCYGMSAYMNNVYQHWLGELECEIILHDKY
jgi:hypothetical protein